METITLRPITDENREAVLALSVREDQPFVASNKTSLRQYEETEEEAPGVAPYCFMKKLSALSTARPKYAFQPIVPDPRESGTYYKELYTGAAQALGSQARLFVYDHGATIY